MTLLQNIMWYLIDTLVVAAIGLFGIWVFVTITGKHKPSRSEVLIEKAYDALKDLEDYYKLYPEEQREKNLKILTGIAIDLAKLDRKLNEEQTI